MFKRYQQIHFVGIGGIGMSGIAEILANLGYRVAGLVPREHLDAQPLEAGHVEGAHVVVYSSAVAADNVEVQATADE